FFAGEPFGYFSISAMLFPEVFPLAMLISCFLGMEFALWQHKWKPLLYGVLWALPTFFALTAAIIPNMRFG
ncbi:MAG: hypothetical protein AAB869_00160, partial [Patescibacteria group bacterium]